MISIIVPVYNIEKYIEKCIRSILNQSFKKIEVILVDDGSTDGSLAICQQYSRLDERIKVITKENGGLSSARNEGIKQSTGEYIAFIDGDDFVHPQYIEKLYNTLSSFDADMSVCGIEIVDENGKITDKLSTGAIYKPYCPFTREKLSPIEVERRYYTEENGFIFVVAWNKLYKRQIFENLLYDEGKIYEDEYLFSTLLRKCREISFVTDKLYFYVQRNNGITSKSKQRDKFQYISEIFYRRISIYENEQNQELITRACEKFLRQIITYYYFLNKEEKSKAKDIYYKIIKQYNMPAIYWGMYPIIGIMSNFKHLKERK